MEREFDESPNRKIELPDINRSRQVTGYPNKTPPVLTVGALNNIFKSDDNVDIWEMPGSRNYSAEVADEIDKPISSKIIIRNLSLIQSHDNKLINNRSSLEAISDYTQI